MVPRLQGRSREVAEHGGLYPFSTTAQQGSYGDESDIADSDEGTSEESDESTIGDFKHRMIRRRRMDFESDSGSAVSFESTVERFDESIDEDSGRTAFERKPEPLLMGPPTLPAQRRFARSPEPSENLLNAGVSKEFANIGALRLGTNQGDDGSEESSQDDKDSKNSIKATSNPSENLLPGDVTGESMETGSPRAGADQSDDGSSKTSHHDENTESTVKPTPGSRDSSMRELYPKSAAFERRAGSATSPSAYNRNHESPRYTDPAEPQLSDAHEKRLEAMRARNAKENHHDRIPPEHAPHHMQMMVLLYQWAAWATEISDQKRREEMTKWVNGRFLHFMMSGGHVPGYNLKELLQIAGVDPKELYGYSSDPIQQGSMADMSSGQLAAAISGQQRNQAQIELEAAGKEKSGAEFEQDTDELKTALEAPPSTTGRRRIVQSDGDDDEEEGKTQIDDAPLEAASPHPDEVFPNHGEDSPTGASEMLHESPSSAASDRKRGATSDVEASDQDAKRQKLDAETVTGALPTTKEVSSSEMAQTSPLPNVASPLTPDGPVQERYLQIFFKPQLNAVLANHQKSQCRKLPPDWPSIAKRLSRVSVNVIKILRHDFHHGWGNWDGSAFSELPGPLQNSSNSSSKDKIKAEPDSPKPAKAKSAPILQKPTPPSKPQLKLNFLPKPKLTRKKANEEYNPEDAEWTAAKSSVTTRNQLAQSHTNSKRRRGGGRRRPNAEGRLQTPLAEVAMLAEVDQLGKD